MTKTTTRARYTLEFKQEAVRLVDRRPEHRGGGPHAGRGGPDAVQLGQGASGRASSPALTARSVSAEQMEISRLRAELARVKMERDILGKATAYFAKAAK